MAVSKKAVELYRELRQVNGDMQFIAGVLLAKRKPARRLGRLLEWVRQGVGVCCVPFQMPSRMLMVDGVTVWAAILDDVREMPEVDEYRVFGEAFNTVGDRRGELDHYDERPIERQNQVNYRTDSGYRHNNGNGPFVANKED